MRIYYVMEAQGRRCHVLSALGVDARAWNRLHRRVREWRRHLELRHTASPPTPNCPPVNLSPATNSPNILRLRLPRATGVARQRVEITEGGLRVVEDLAVETGGVQVVNVCLDMDEAYRPTAASPWTASSTASTPPPTGITTAATPSSSSGRNPTRWWSAPTSGCAATTRCPCASAPAATAGTPATFPSTGSSAALPSESPGDDCLLQVAGLVAHALLWR